MLVSEDEVLKAPRLLLVGSFTTWPVKRGRGKLPESSLLSLSLQSSSTKSHGRRVRHKVSIRRHIHARHSNRNKLQLASREFKSGDDDDDDDDTA